MEIQNMLRDLKANNSFQEPVAFNNCLSVPTDLEEPGILLSLLT